MKSATLATGDAIPDECHGLADLTFHDGSLARIDRNTTFTISKLGSTNAVKTRLAKGQVWNEVTKASGSPPITRWLPPTRSRRCAARSSRCRVRPARLHLRGGGRCGRRLHQHGHRGRRRGHPGDGRHRRHVGQGGSLQPSAWIQQNQQLFDIQEGRPSYQFDQRLDVRLCDRPATGAATTTASSRNRTTTIPSSRAAQRRDTITDTLITPVDLPSRRLSCRRPCSPAPMPSPPLPSPSPSPSPSPPPPSPPCPARRLRRSQPPEISRRT